MTTLVLPDSLAKEIYPSANPELKKILESSFPGGKKFFSKNIIERIQSYEDACEEIGQDPIESIPHKYPKNNRQKAANAFHMLDTITEALLEGVILDWENGNQQKWYCWFYNYKKGSGFRFYGSDVNWTYTTSDGGARLCVDTKAKSDHLGSDLFINIWNDYLNPNK